MLTWCEDEDPRISLHFSVTAGSSPTTFTISSSVVSFAPIANPEAVASSSLTLTDTNGNGASLTGLEGGGKSFRAIYNGGVTWVRLNSSFSDSVPYDGQIVSDRYPISGFQIISDTLTSIESEYKFTLSAFDEASGTSTFNVQPIIPEPITVLSVGTGIAGLLQYARRRLPRNRLL